MVKRIMSFKNAPWFVLLLAVLLLAGCKGWAGQRSTSSTLDLGIASEQMVEIEDRPFLVTVIDKMVDSPFGTDSKVRFQALAIDGDNRRFSFDSTTGPYQLVISGSTIEYGGYTFTVTATAGEYIIDNKRVMLSEGPRTVHIFQDGKYFGIVQY